MHNIFKYNLQSTSFRVIEHTNERRCCSIKTEIKIYQIPEFTSENIPLKEADRIMNKDYQYV